MTKAELMTKMIKDLDDWGWMDEDDYDVVIKWMVEEKFVELDDMKPEEKADSDIGW